MKSQGQRQRRRRTLKIPAAPPAPPPEPTSHEAFAQRLRHIVERAGSILALADAAKVSDSAIYSWLRGSEPSREKLIALADAAHVRLEWLAAGRGPLQAAHLGAVPPGYFIIRQAYLRTPNPLIAFSGLYLSVAGIDSSPEDLILTFAVGEAMAPTIRDGDMLLIDTAKKEKADGVCVAIDQGGSLVVRRLQRRVEGGLNLLCDNPAYPPTDVSDVELIGRLVWRGGRLPS